MKRLWKKVIIGCTLVSILTFSFVVREKVIFADIEAPRKNLTSILKHRALIRKLISCESQGRNIKKLDVNGLYSYGVLQIQSSTWNAWSEESGIKGSPMSIRNSIEMTDWAIENGYLHHWSCANILGLVKKE